MIGGLVRRRSLLVTLRRHKPMDSFALIQAAAHLISWHVFRTPGLFQAAGRSTLSSIR
jgi:hypothetical protein